MTCVAVAEGGIDACGEQRARTGRDLFFVQIAASAYQRWSRRARCCLLVSYRPLAAACIRDHVVDPSDSKLVVAINWTIRAFLR